MLLKPHESQYNSIGSVHGGILATALDSVMGCAVHSKLRVGQAHTTLPTGIQSIVEGADVPKGSFYNHFPSKEAFGTEVIDAYFDRGQDKLRDFLCNPDVAPLADWKPALTTGSKRSGLPTMLEAACSAIFGAEAADHSAAIRKRQSKISQPGAAYSRNVFPKRRSRGRSVSNFLRRRWLISYSTAGRVRCCVCAWKRATRHSSSLRKLSLISFSHNAVTREHQASRSPLGHLRFTASESSLGGRAFWPTCSTPTKWRSGRPAMAAGSKSRASVIRTFRSARPQRDPSSNKSASPETRATCFADSNHHKETWKVIVENGSFRSR